tara:strand:+ start:3306 stop:4280 length:975 start_codon:yes stop_codon:yes gene_type:complete
MTSNFHNKNFKLTELFKKFLLIDYTSISNILNNIQKDKKYLPNFNKLYKIKLCVSDNLNKSNSENTKVDEKYFNSNNNFYKNKPKPKEKLSINETKEYLNNDNDKKVLKKTILCSNKIINEISVRTKSEIKFIDKKNDYLSYAYFNSLSGKFYILNDFEKKAKLKDMKIYIINKFAKENFYKHFHYTSRYFKKSELDNVFMNNLPLTDFMLKVYSDIFNTNTILIDNQIKFISNFIPNRTTVIIYQDKYQVFYLNNKSYFRGFEIQQFLPKFNYTEEELNSKKLDELFNIAKSKNIKLKKKGKSDLINCKKNEIILNILNNVLN